jgi:RNA polymerase sigma-70 factor, ECF subfamily
MAPTDNELIILARRGDVAAFEQLVRRHDKKVFGIAAGYVRNAEDAKDIYQEVFLRVYRSLPKFQMRSEFSTWLHRITTNVCLTYQVRSRRHDFSSLFSSEEIDPLNEGLCLEAADAAPDRKTMDGEITQYVQQALAALSPQQRLVFTLRHYEGYKLKEIAAMMDCAEGTVKRYLFTATEKLKKELSQVFG